MFKFLLSVLLFTSFALVNSSQIEDKSLASDVGCELCTVVISGARNLLEQNKTEAEILGFMEKELCQKLGSLAQICTQYVEAYGKIVLQELADKISPELICKRLGLCSAKLEKLPLQNEIQQKNQETKTSGTVCQICTVVMSAAQNLLEQNKTEEQIISFIQKDLCSKLGSLSSTCNQYVQAYGSVILYELAQKIDPSLVCNHLGLCETMQVAPHSILKPLSNSLNCTLCKLVFQQVINLLKNNASEQQIINTIETRLCNATGKFSAVCKTIVDAYGPSILNYLASGVDPEKLCDLIGMCTGKKATGRLSHLVKRELKLDYIPNLKDNTKCTVCQYAIQFIDYEIGKNSTEAAVVNTLDRVCNLAPASLKSECDQLINTYGIFLVQLLIQYADPLKVCQAIKLC